MRIRMAIAQKGLVFQINRNEVQKALREGFAVDVTVPEVVVEVEPVGCLLLSQMGESPIKV